jgi:hypothetical protein
MTSRAGWGGVRPGSGRKPLPAKERRKHRVTVFLNDSEFAALTRLASEHNHSRGTVAYALVALGLSRVGLKPRRERT